MLLNGQNYFLKGITSGVPQGSILETLLFLIYINDLSSSCKLFADDASLFSVVHNVTNRDVSKISERAFKWKMSFNPDPNKPV